MDLNKIDLLSLQTSYMQKDNFVQALCKALNPVFQKLSDSTRLVFIYGRIDELEEEAIDSLAWQFHVDFYDYSLSLDQKRELVKKAILLHITKGTASSVEEVVASSLFENSYIKEWFEYGGNPYFFIMNIDISDRGASKFELNKLDNIIESYKNKRSWLEKVNIHYSSNLKINISAALRQGEIIRVYPYTPNELRNTLELPCKISERSIIETVRVYPRSEKYYVIDELGNRVIDENGNYVVIKIGNYYTDDCKFYVIDEFGNKVVNENGQKIYLSKEEVIDV
ncbi:phage tail protein I [Clostridium butyricum]